MSWSTATGQPRWGHATTTVVGGDALSLSIAAASIVAKVTRDAIMTGLAVHHPGYGWATNMGYATREHCDGLARLGATVHHRAGFAPVAAGATIARRRGRATIARRRGGAAIGRTVSLSGNTPAVVVVHRRGLNP